MPRWEIGVFGVQIHMTVVVTVGVTLRIEIFCNRNTPGRVGFIHIVFKDGLTFDMLDIDSTGNMNFSADLQKCKMCGFSHHCDAAFKILIGFSRIKGPCDTLFCLRIIRYCFC